MIVITFFFWVENNNYPLFGVTTIEIYIFQKKKIENFHFTHIF